jgi:hypothetical protein
VLADYRVVWLKESNNARPFLAVVGVEERRPPLPILHFHSGAAADELNHDLKQVLMFNALFGIWRCFCVAPLLVLLCFTSVV